MESTQQSITLPNGMVVRPDDENEAYWILHPHETWTRIKELREKIGYTWAELAEVCDFKEKQLAWLSYTEGRPNIKVRIGLLRALGIPDDVPLEKVVETPLENLDSVYKVDTDALIQKGWLSPNNNPKYIENFWKNINLFNEILHTTRKDLSEELGMSAPGLTMMLKRGKMPDQHQLRTIASFYGISENNRYILYEHEISEDEAHTICARKIGDMRIPNQVSDSYPNDGTLLSIGRSSAIDAINHMDAAALERLLTWMKQQGFLDKSN